MKRKIIKKNTKIGFLTYLKDSVTSEKHRHAYWRCVCGKEVDVRISAVKEGNTISCGCRNKEGGKMPQVCKIDMALNWKSRLMISMYKTWTRFMNRCYNERWYKYHRYGGRGIKVWDRWHSFRNFYNDCRDNYEKSMTRYKKVSIDRLDNDGDYEPNNVSFTSVKINSRVKSNTRLYNINGKVINETQLCKRFKGSRDTLRKKFSGSLLSKQEIMRYKTEVA